MKTTIKLTEEQIEAIIGERKRSITETAAKKIKQIEQERDRQIETLKKKYKNFTITIEDDTPPLPAPAKNKTGNGENDQPQKEAKQQAPQKGGIDEDKMIEMHARGKSTAEIAKALGVTWAAVNNRMKKLGMEGNTLRGKAQR